MEPIKHLFYQNKIWKAHISTDDEAMKQLMMEVNIEKQLNKYIDSVDKAHTVLTNLIVNKKINESDYMAFTNQRKKYFIFNVNIKQLENSKVEYVYIMDKISLDEVTETIVDRKKKILNRKYPQAMFEIFRSSYCDEIVRPTSGGLATPTCDFIDDLPNNYNPFDDIGSYNKCFIYFIVFFKEFNSLK